MQSSFVAKLIDILNIENCVQAAVTLSVLFLRKTSEMWLIMKWCILRKQYKIKPYKALAHRCSEPI